jgi:hypothetical protein
LTDLLVKSVEINKPEEEKEQQQQVYPVKSK